MAAQDPELWLTNRRAAGGATSAMLWMVIEPATEFTLAELQRKKISPPGRRARKTKA